MRNTGSPRRPGAWIEVFWGNPPGAQQGVTVRRRIRGKVYQRDVGAYGSLDVHEAAEVLGMNFLSVYRAVQAGRLRAVKKKNAPLMIPLGEVKRYLSQRRRGRPPGVGRVLKAVKNPPQKTGSRRRGAAWFIDAQGRPWMSG